MAVNAVSVPPVSSWLSTPCSEITQHPQTTKSKNVSKAVSVVVPAIDPSSTQQELSSPPPHPNIPRRNPSDVVVKIVVNFKKVELQQKRNLSLHILFRN